MSGLWHDALAGLRARRWRTALSAAGIALSAAMLATAAVVAYGLDTGFQRSAHAADLPDVIVRFDPQSLATVERRIRALPDLAAASYRLELTNVQIAGAGHSTGQAVAEVLSTGRRGYAVLAGHDLSASRPGVVVEQGVARTWGLRVGSPLTIGGLGAVPVSGIARVAGQRRLSARRAADLPLASGDRRPLRPRARPRSERGRAVAARPQPTRRGARAGADAQLRDPRAALRHPRRRQGPPRPGGRDRDRPARGAVGDRAADGGGDARRLRAGGGPAAARRDRSAAGARREQGPRRPSPRRSRR